MPALSTTAGMLPRPAAPMNPRVATATAIVIAAHVALVALVLLKRDEPVMPLALASQTMTAELLQPEPVAAPAAIQSTPTPPPPKPVPHVTPRVKPQVQPTPKPTPTPLPVADAPSQHQIESAAPATPPAPAAPATQAAAAPAPGKPTMALDAPKNVSHLDCRIAQPDYPALSTRRGETGVAYVSFVVGLTGKIENIDLKKSSGFSRLDNAALAAMRDSSCKPYMENGEPVRAAYTQPFDFSLHD